MTALTALAFLGLTVANRAVGGSMLYPPAVFTATWGGCLLWLALLGDRFFPVSAETLGIFLLGGVMLSLGGLVVRLFKREPERRATPVGRSERTVERLITIGLWACVLAFPLRLLRVKELAASQGATDFFSLYFWGAVRRASIVEADQNRFRVLALTDNFILLAGLLALAALALDVARKRLSRRTVALVALALVYNLMTAGRAGAMGLLLGLVAISWVVARRLPWNVIALSLASGVVVFSVVAIVLGKGGSPFASTRENVGGIWESLELYTLGGIVGFDHTVRQPEDIPPAWSVTRSFVQVANKLGARVELPSLHAEWSQVSEHEWTNVYTIFFAYFPRLGWAGVTGLTFVLGFVMSWLYCSARGGDPRSRLLFAAAFGGLVLSAFNEEFYLNLNLLTKAALFSVVLYGLPVIRTAPRAARLRAAPEGKGPHEPEGRVLE